MSKLNVVVLAAGKGTRMYSTLPKVLHTLAGKPLLQHTLDTARALGASRIHVVIGYGAELVREALAGQDVNLVLQEQQLGTGHAVQQVLPFLEADAMTLVLYGDVPLITRETLERLLEPLDENSMSVLTCEVANPAGLGRIMRDAGGNIEAIVEDRDADLELKAIREINTGIMAFPAAKLDTWLSRIGKGNAQGEYYLTDIVRIALEDRCKVLTSTLHDEIEALGVNNRQQLAQLERHFQKREAERLLLAGLTLRDPARFDLRGSLDFGLDADIDINVIIEGKVTLGANVRIGPNCVISNCSIGDGTVIAANSVLEDAVIGSGCSIGPFARIRPGTCMAEHAKVGNFVEVKKSVIGRQSKINHLSYVGDSELGEGVNVGAGTITCNYDGVNKSRTVVGDNVFIGSNSVLVAPVTVASGAFVAAGSTITEAVPEKHLAIGRSRQVNKDGWSRPAKRDKS